MEGGSMPKMRIFFTMILLGLFQQSLLANSLADRVSEQVSAEDTALRTSYALDSLYFHGSGGASDQSISAGETITFFARLSGGTWHATAPIDEVGLIPNTNDPSDSGGADLDNYYSYSNSDASFIYISGVSLAFTLTAPSNWETGDQTFTVYFDGNCTGLHQAQVSETYASIAGVTVLHSGDESVTNGFTIGDMVHDTTSPTFVLAGTYAETLTTIRLQTSETAFETGGDCGGNFEVTGGGISGTIFGSSLSGSGTVWTLTLASALPDRGWQGNIAYDRENSANEFEDASNNEVVGLHNVTSNTEHIDPVAPSMSTPDSDADLTGSSLSWTGTADNGTTDPSLANVGLQGSNDGSSWSAVLNTDSNTSDTAYSGSWTIGTQYAYYRLLATDSEGNTASSGASINYQDLQRILLSGTVDEEPATYEDVITANLTDAYGNAESSTKTLSLTKISGAGTVTFRKTPGGSNITSLDIISGSSTTFYMASSEVGTHVIRVNNAALIEDDLSCTISSGAATKLLVKLPGQSFTDGVGISGSPSAQTAGSSFNFNLIIVDVSNYQVDETGGRTVNFASTAANSPDADAPLLDGVTAGSWTARSVTFTSGESAAISATFYDTDAATITVTDPDGVPALTGTASSSITTAAATADHLTFSIDASSSESTLDWGGTNTVTVLDRYGNTDSDFNASSNNVTVSSDTGTLDIASRGDAILDLGGDFSAGQANLTSLGINLTVGAGTYTIDGSISVAAGIDPNVTDSKSIVVNAPTLSNTSPAWRFHVNAESDSPGYMLQADCDENGESLKIYYAFDDDSTKYSGYAALDSVNVTSGSGLVEKYITGSIMNTMGDGLDYMFWWVGGTDSEGNPPDGKPTSSNRMVYLVNPTLSVQGSDLGSSMLPSSTNNPLTRMILSAEMPGAEIVMSRVDFSKTSSSNATTTHISAFKLWRDVNTNGVYDQGTDVQLGSTQTGTTSPSFTGLNQTVVEGTITYLLLTVDVSAAATGSQTLGMELTGDNVFVLQDNVDDVYPFGGSWPQPASASDHTLPVELSTFDGAALFGSNMLKWRTESEDNSLGFRVWRAPAEAFGMRPSDALFSSVADWNLNPELLGMENTTAATKYTWLDKSVTPGELYCYQLESVDLDGQSEMHSEFVYVESLRRPLGFNVKPSFPNPFNPSTTLSFVLPQDNTVRLDVFDITGRLVRTLLAGEHMGWGEHQVVWDGRNAQGQPAASGYYLMHLSTPDFKHTQKVALLK
jgi:hypothetical protein